MVVYRSEAFYGEVMVVDVTVGEFSRVGCDFFYRLSDQDSGREVVRAKTGIVFFDYEVRKTAAVPPKFKALFDEGA